MPRLMQEGGHVCLCVERQQQTLGISGDNLTGSLVGFLDLFMREARIKHVQPRTVAEDFLLARKMWMDEYRNGPS